MLLETAELTLQEATTDLSQDTLQNEWCPDLQQFISSMHEDYLINSSHQFHTLQWTLRLHCNYQPINAVKKNPCWLWELFEKNNNALGT